MPENQVMSRADELALLIKSSKYLSRIKDGGLLIVEKLVEEGGKKYLVCQTADTDRKRFVYEIDIDLPLEHELADGGFFNVHFMPHAGHRAIRCIIRHKPKVSIA